MTNQPPKQFDPRTALLASRVSANVKFSDHQAVLDITERERTSVLPWKGQFSPQLVEFLLDRHAKKSAKILDPFCGSGTVLHEAAAIGMGATGIDINPAAVSLAKVAEICATKQEERRNTRAELNAFHQAIISRAWQADNTITALDAATTLLAAELNCHTRIAATAYLMLAFGDTTKTDSQRLSRSLASIVRTVENMPTSSLPISARIGDARKTGVPSDSIDYILTSPPYINVFNYHQNYRPIVEALGQNPLISARTEIGANRKFRQNRFMTVIQYCMDISLMLSEMARVLKPMHPMTIILGRESSVRSVPFRNGELVSAISVSGMGFTLLEWNERKFVNRYGAVIFEDILTLVPRGSDVSPIEIGRAVGRQALTAALEECPDDRRQEVEAAIESSDTIEASHYI